MTTRAIFFGGEKFPLGVLPEAPPVLFHAVVRMSSHDGKKRDNGPLIFFLSYSMNYTEVSFIYGVFILVSDLLIVLFGPDLCYRNFDLF